MRGPWGEGGAEETVKVKKWLSAGNIHTYDLQREKINTQRDKYSK